MSQSPVPEHSPLVLLANDQEWAVRSLESVLVPHGYRVIRAYGGRGVLELVRTHRPDALVLDLHIPDEGGIASCRALRASGALPASVPIIITTAAEASRTARVEAYEAGAWDFLTEPLDLEIFLPKLRVFVRAKLEGDEIRRAALVDSETGLYNSPGIIRRAGEIVAAATRSHEPVACVAFSVAGGVADALPTAAIAAYVQAVCVPHLRASDVLGRVGPETFVILACGVAHDGCERLIERLRGAIASRTLPIDGQEQGVCMRAAASVSLTPHGGADTAHFVRAAIALLADSASSIVEPEWRELTPTAD